MSSLKFPPTVEIKRAIAAVERAGVQISIVEIHPRKIVIHAVTKDETKISPYDLWTQSEGGRKHLGAKADKKSDAKLTKSST